MIIQVTTNVNNGTINNSFVIKHAIDESINDFHFFCLSIVKDLITKKHKLDQFGVKTFTYPFDFDEDDIEDFEDAFEYMASIIVAERLKKKDSFDNLITDN